MALKKSKTVKRKPSKSRLGNKKSKTVKRKPSKSRLRNKKSKSVKRKPSKSRLGKKKASLKKRLLKQRAGENTSEDEYQDLLPRDSIDWTTTRLNPPCLVKNKEGVQIDPTTESKRTYIRDRKGITIKDAQGKPKYNMLTKIKYEHVKKLSNFKKFMLLQDMDEEKLKTFLDSDTEKKFDFLKSWKKCKENKDKCKEAFRELKFDFDDYLPKHYITKDQGKYRELDKFYREKYGLCKDKYGKGQYEYDKGCVLPCIDEDYETKGKLSTWKFFEKKKKIEDKLREIKEKIKKNKKKNLGNEYLTCNKSEQLQSYNSDIADNLRYDEDKTCGAHKFEEECNNSCLKESGVKCMWVGKKCTKQTNKRVAKLTGKNVLNTVTGEISGVANAVMRI